MKDSIITQSGKLKNKWLPAVYFDSSVLIDYYNAEGMEFPEGTLDYGIRKHELPHLQVVRDLLRSDQKIKKMADIRRKIILDLPKVTPVTSPLALLELIEWYAEATFRNIASEVSGTKHIQRKNKKDIGGYLKQIMEQNIRERTKKSIRKGPSSGLELLLSETWLSSSYLESHGLQGILQPDILEMSLTIEQVWKTSAIYAYLQVGAADILHLILAEHLGCKYFASFDADFKRIRNYGSRKTRMKVLTSPEEILQML